MTPTVISGCQFHMTFSGVTIPPRPGLRTVTDVEATELMANSMFASMVKNGTYVLIDFPEGDDGVPGGETW